MHLRTPLRSQRTRTALCAVAVTCGLTAAACSSSSGASSTSSAATAASSASSAVTASSDGTATAASSSSGSASSGSSSSATSGRSAAAGDATFLSSDTVHEISITFDDAAYQDMLSAFRSSGDKQWIEVTVTIDGTTYAKAGARLKGNSSLRTLLGGFGGRGPGAQNGNASTPTTTATTPAAESLPWFIRLDKYVDGQNHEGVTDLIVRSNNTQTALNEAVALDLLRTAGLASEQAALVRFTANGSAADLRLVVENLDETWDAENFDGDGILYKAESTGDYTYRGTDPSAYDDVFDQETGTEDDLTPLIEFLDFVNNSDDATFAADLSKHLDVDSFATYLAFEELVDNFDDIDGPGNNSYLRWDAGTGVMTVVAWDHNLAFGSTPGGGGGPGGFGGFGGAGGQGGGQGGQFPPGGGQLPAGGQPPAGGDADQGGGFPGGGRGGPGGFGRSNPLVTRFNAVPEFKAKVDAAKTALTGQLYTGGAATESLTRWSDLISSQASDLVDSATLQSERASIEKYVK